jgi:hypothetical protein
MKKWLWFLVLSLGLCWFSTAAMAVTNEASSQNAALLRAKQAELQKVKAYLETLDGKIEEAQAAGETKRVNQLQAVKTKNAARIPRLESDIELLSMVVGVPVTIPGKLSPVRLGSWRANAGYGCGALFAGGGYSFPAAGSFNWAADGNLFIGNGYSVIFAEGAGVWWSGPEVYYRLGLGLASYSQTIADIPLTGGNQTQGLHVNLGLYAGRQIGDWAVQAGWGNALGITLGASKQF